MTVTLIDPDNLFFRQHPDRSYHVRDAKDRESEGEFASLGPHDVSRRRIILVKVPRDNPIAPGKVLKIPFLVYTDDTLRDDDATLGPIVAQLMADAAAGYGIKTPLRRE